MRKSIVWALTAMLAIAPTAPAYATEQTPRGRAFFSPGTDLSTPEKYAREIEKCATDNTASRLSCDMLVSSFNAAFEDIDDVRNYRELADYFRTETEVRPCPQVVILRTSSATRSATPSGNCMRIAFSTPTLSALFPRPAAASGRRN
jgi:hypothetical protein